MGALTEIGEPSSQGSPLHLNTQTHDLRLRLSVAVDGALEQLDTQDIGHRLEAKGRCRVSNT